MTEPRWQAVGALLLCSLAVVMLATVSDYGLTWDEEFQSNYGELILAWFASGFQNDGALQYRNLYLYGGLFDVAAQLFARTSPLDLYEDRHLVNVAVGLLALAGTWRLGHLVVGRRGGVLALAIAALTPMFYGHSFNNPKDIPFAAAFVWALCHLVESARALPAIDYRATVKLCISLGLVLAIRPGGIFFLSFIGVWWGYSIHRVRSGRVALLRAAGTLMVVVAGAWALMLICWPWAQTSPLLNPLRAMRRAGRFSFGGTTLLLGEQVPAQNPPLEYLPAWFSVQLPEVYFLAGAAAVIAVWFKQRPPATTDADTDYPGRAHELPALVCVVAMPVVLAITLRSTLYDAVRHFLFLVPPLAVLAAAGFDRALRPPVPRYLRALIAAAALAAGAVTAVDMIALHPYQSVYFNRVVAGSLRGAAGRFETDYWGNTYREAVEWVVSNVPGTGIRVANCSYPLQSAYYLRGSSASRFVPVAMESQPDLLLATTRWDCHQQPGARVLHRVERQGVPLAYVLDLRRPGSASPPKDISSDGARPR